MPDNSQFSPLPLYGPPPFQPALSSFKSDFNNFDQDSANLAAQIKATATADAERAAVAKQLGFSATPLPDAQVVTDNKNSGPTVQSSPVVVNLPDSGRNPNKTNSTSFTVASTILNKDIAVLPFPFMDQVNGAGIIDNMKFRVFIMGAEFSPHVQDITWTSDASSEMIGSNSTITFKVTRDLLTYTQKNLSPVASSKVQNSITSTQVGLTDTGQVNWVLSNDFRVDETPKMQLYNYKYDNNFYDTTTLTGRWNLSIGSLCINHGDTIRIFAQLPWTEKDAWLPVFTGYVREPSITRNQTGEDVISINCYTLAEKLTRARVLSKLSATLVDPLNSPVGQKLGDAKQIFNGKTGVNCVDMDQIMKDNLGGLRNILLDTTLQGLLNYIFYGDSDQVNDDQVSNTLGAVKVESTDALVAAALAKAEADLAIATATVDNLANDKKATPLQVAQANRLKDLATAAKNSADKTVAAKNNQDSKDNHNNRSLGFLDQRLFIQWGFPSTAASITQTTDQTTNTVNNPSSQSPASGTTYRKVPPVPLNIISTQYGASTKYNAHHMAVDIATQPIDLIAPIAGTLGPCGSGNNEQGNRIELKGEDGSYHAFYHLSNIADGIGEYVKVSVGTTLGRTGGATGSLGAGRSTGPHLHWAVWVNRTVTNPLTWLTTANSDPTPLKVAATLARPTQGNTTSSTTPLDWPKEIDYLEIWKTMNLVGWANSIPPSTGASALTSADLNQIDTLRPPAISKNIATGKTYKTYDSQAALKRAMTQRLDSDGDIRSYLSNNEVTVIGRNSGWFGIYSPHGSCVAIAIKVPKAGWGSNHGFTTDISVQDASFQAGVQTKAQILTELLGRLDYYWYVTGNGDFIFEFPAYELNPVMYGVYENSFTFTNIVQTDTMQESFQNLKAIYVFTGAVTWVGNDEAGAGSANRLIQVIFKLPTVAVRNGIEIEETHNPFITKIDSLRTYGAIKIREAIANSYTYSTSSLPPLLYVQPNTPVYLTDKDCYALVKKVTFTANLASPSFKANFDFTAIRQRLTPEQLFLANYSNSFSVSNTPSAGGAIIMPSSYVNSMVASAPPNSKQDPTSWINYINNSYGYIYGTTNLLINYFDTYNNALSKQNDFELSKDPTNEGEKAVNPSSVAVFQNNNRLSATLAPDPSGILRSNTKSGLFTQATNPPVVVQQAIASALTSQGLPSSLGTAMAAHANTTTNSQQNWFDNTVNYASGIGAVFAAGIGVMGLTGKVISQLQGTPAGAATLTQATALVPPVTAKTTGDQAAATRSLQQVWGGITGSNLSFPVAGSSSYNPSNQLQTQTPGSTQIMQSNQLAVNPIPIVQLDPRSNIQFSCNIAALIMKEMVNQIIKNSKGKANLTGADLNPDILAMAIYYGPKDPAVKLTLKNPAIDPTDQSQNGTNAWATALQQNLLQLGTYSKRDIDYCSSYRKIRTAAQKQGLYSLS